MNGLVQVLSARYSTEQIVWARAASHFVFVLALFVPPWASPCVRTTTPKWQIIRSMVHLMSMLFFFTGVKYLPLAKAASISFTAPFFVALLAWPMLGERITPNRLVAIIVAFLGVLVVIRPGSDVFQWASLYMLGSAVCYALYQILTRRVAGLRLGRDHRRLQRAGRHRRHVDRRAVRVDADRVVDRRRRCCSRSASSAARRTISSPAP